MKRRKQGNASRRSGFRKFSLKSGITGPNRTILAQYQARAKGYVCASDGFDVLLKSMRHRMGEEAFEKYLKINPVTADRYIRNLCTMVGDWDADRFVVLADDLRGRCCLYWNGSRNWLVLITMDYIYKSIAYPNAETAKWYWENEGVSWKEKQRHDNLMQEMQKDRYPEPTT